ncbi:hypothetical protein [Streptomyces niveus]
MNVGSARRKAPPAARGPVVAVRGAVGSPPFASWSLKSERLSRRSYTSVCGTRCGFSFVTSRRPAEVSMVGAGVPFMLDGLDAFESFGGGDFSRSSSASARTAARFGGAIVRASASSMGLKPPPNPTIHSLGGAIAPTVTPFPGAGSGRQRANFLPPRW